jgi:hypothetical protein
MNHDQREILEDGDYFDNDYWDYYEYEHYFDYGYYGDDVSYERKENGLVDWSEEIPVAVKRQHKIDEILGNIDDKSNSLDKFWPKND